MICSYNYRTDQPETTVKIDRIRFIAVPAVQLLGNVVFMNSAEPVPRLNCDERKASLGQCQTTFVCSTTGNPKPWICDQHLTQRFYPVRLLGGCTFNEFMTRSQTCSELY
jgi:hypothetical protein